MFDYLYEQDIRAMQVITVPKMLFSAPQFILLSAQAKVLYAVLLESCDDRNSERPCTSIPIYEICDDMCCSASEAVKMLKELSDFGLICVDNEKIFINDFKRTEV